MTKRLSDEELADLGRLEAAVRGKWSCVYDGDELWATLRTGSFSLTAGVSGLLDPRVHELSLACAARNALPSLVAEVRESRREILEYRKVLNCSSAERGWTCGKCNSCEDYSRIIMESSP